MPASSQKSSRIFSCFRLLADRQSGRVRRRQRQSIDASGRHARGALRRGPDRQRRNRPLYLRGDGGRIAHGHHARRHDRRAHRYAVGSGRLQLHHPRHGCAVRNRLARLCHGRRYILAGGAAEHAAERHAGRRLQPDAHGGRWKSALYLHQVVRHAANRSDAGVRRNDERDAQRRRRVHLHHPGPRTAPATPDTVPTTTSPSAAIC
jgi:hypothetical protein